MRKAGKMAETVWSDVLAGLPMPAMLVAREDRVTACNEPALALLGSAILGRNPAMAVRTPAPWASAACGRPMWCSM